MNNKESIRKILHIRCWKFCSIPILPDKLFKGELDDKTNLFLFKSIGSIDEICKVLI